MTVEEREAIFAKECLSIADIQKLYDLEYNDASGVIRDIKGVLTIGRKKKLRWDRQGKLHMQDYLDYIGVEAPDRYIPRYKETLEKAESLQEKTNGK